MTAIYILVPIYILKLKLKFLLYIYIKSKGIHQPENLMSNGSSRHDDAAQAK